jgi:hypothetical protein
MFKSSGGGQTALASLESKLAGGAPDDPAVPATLRNAVRFMLAGAGTTALFGIFTLVVWMTARDTLTDSKGNHLNNAQFAGSIVSIVLFVIIVPVTLWLLMARLNRAGRGWARITASVLCAIWSYSTISAISSLKNGQTITWYYLVSLIVEIITWVVGVGAVALLWRRQTSDYFNAQANPR